MPGRIIKESFILTATTVDVLAAPSRLAAIPANGVLTIEATANDADVTNQGLLTLQLPNGDIPMQDLMIPSGNPFNAADVVLDTNTELLIQMVVTQGGHVGLDYTEVGTVGIAFLHVTLEF